MLNSSVSDIITSVERINMQTQQRIAVISSVITLATILTGSLAILSLFISSPRDIGPVGVTIWFLITFVFLGGIIGLSSYHYSKKKVDNKSGLGLVFKNSIRSGYVFAGLVVILLALQSLRMLSVGDTILFVLIALVMELYFRTKR